MLETAARPVYDINNSLAYCCQKKCTLNMNYS